MYEGLVPVLSQRSVPRSLLVLMTLCQDHNGCQPSPSLFTASVAFIRSARRFILKPQSHIYIFNGLRCAAVKAALGVIVRPRHGKGTFFCLPLASDSPGLSQCQMQFCEMHQLSPAWLMCLFIESFFFRVRRPNVSFPDRGYIITCHYYTLFFS